MNYYNEFEKYPAQWLRNLAESGEIPRGDVDERSITDVPPDSLKEYTQAHFFAGIGGWPYALRLAGWPEDVPVWTGSCPCQPFSNAGKGKGTADERHLWPAFRWLIAKCRPPIVFGEQVASKSGREWLAGVRSDLEALGYVVGAADLCVAGVGAPHIRQRLFWVAHSTGLRHKDVVERPSESIEQDKFWKATLFGGPGSDSGLANARLQRQEREEQQTTRDVKRGPWDDFYLIPCADGKQRRVGFRFREMVDGVSRDLERPCPITPLTKEDPQRVGKLKAYGNSVCIPITVEFIIAVMEVLNEISIQAKES